MHPALAESFPKEDYLYLQGRGILDDFTPKDIERWLHTEGGVVGQDQACKIAAIIIHRHFQQRCPSINLFCGPSGSGKSFIWKAVEHYLSPKVIVRIDSSSLSPEGGWKGGNKISTIFRSLPKDTREKCVLVLDEIDKAICEPQFGSNNTNYSEILQNSLLKLFEHDRLFFGPEEGRDGFHLNVSQISVVCLGAFQHLIEAKSRDTKTLGFGAELNNGCSYADTIITTDDLLKYTCIREEICGRFDRIVTLQPLKVEDYLRIMTQHIDSVSTKIQIPIDIDSNALITIARMSVGQNMGARWAIHKVESLIDEMVYNDPYPERYIFRYEPPDADEKRQNLCF